MSFGLGYEFLILDKVSILLEKTKQKKTVWYLIL